MERLTSLHSTSHKFRNVFVFLRKDEVITLQPFVSLSFFSPGGVSLVGERSPSSLCALLCQKMAKLYWRLSSALMLIHSEWLQALWDCVKTSPSSPRPPHPFPNIFLHLQTQMKPPKEICCVSRCQIHFQCGWGSQWDYVMIAQNNQSQAVGLQTEVVHWASSS